MAWDKSIGQDKVISILKNYIKTGRASGSFMFSGLKGVGKFSIAKEFARACNCAEGRLNACGKCLSGIQIEQEIHLDMFITRPSGKADEITIDMIKELQHLYLLIQKV